MSEEIKIGVSAPGMEDTAAKMARLKKEAEELKRLGDFREQQGDQMGAKFARQDARKVEKELAQMTRERAAEERAITRERTKQAAEAKLAEKEGFLGGMGGLNAAQAVTGLVAGIVKQFVDFSMESAIRSAGIAGGGIASANRTGQIAGIGGIRGEGLAASDYQSKRDELEALKAKRGSISDVPETYLDQFKSGMKERLGINLGETSSAREKRELEEKITLGEAELANAKKLAEQKFKGGTGGMELAQSKARAAGHYEEAKMIEWKLKGEKAYAKVLEQSGGNKQLAGEARDAAVKQAQNEWVRLIGSTLTGRSGQGAIARSAGIAAAGFGSGGEVKQEFKSLREQMAAQHMDMKNIRPTPHFGSKPLR